MGKRRKGGNSGNDSIFKMNHIPVSQFKFHDPFEEESTNGLYFNNVCIPEEVIFNILNFVPPKYLLPLTLVCKRWCNIIKSECFWMCKYNKQCSSRAKKLPWYAYYCYFSTNNFINLLENGNGQEHFKHWTIVINGGNRFKIETIPEGSDPLSSDVPEFKGYGSCFVTSYLLCNKIQKISLVNKRLLRYIINEFMPHIYVSEWVAGRFDCGCKYRLGIRGCSDIDTNSQDLDATADPDESTINSVFYLTNKVQLEPGSKWEKVNILNEEYPKNITTLIFEHEGQDTQFWAGHYGSKMAGGVVKFVFDSIQPNEDN